MNESSYFHRVLSRRVALQRIVHRPTTRQSPPHTVNTHANFQLEQYVGPVPTYCEAVRLIFDLLSRKLAHRLVLPWGTFTPTVVYLCLLLFETESRKGQTDRQRPISRPIRTAAVITAQQ